MSAFTRSLIAASTSGALPSGDCAMRVEHFGDHAADLLEFGDAKAARGRRRRAEAKARGDERRFRIERDAVLVAGDARRAPAPSPTTLPFEALGPEIDQHQMVVGAAGDDVEAVARAGFRPAPWRSRPRSWRRP